MPVFTVRWYDDAKTILLFDVVEDWDWKDAYDFLRTQGEWLATVEHDVHTIIHFHNVRTLPRAPGLMHIRKIMQARYPNEQLAVFVSTNRVIEMILGTVGRMYGLSHLMRYYRFVPTLDDALRVIAEFERQQE